VTWHHIPGEQEPQSGLTQMAKTSVLKGTNYINKGRKLDVKFIYMHCTVEETTAVTSNLIIYTVISIKFLYSHTSTCYMCVQEPVPPVD